MLELLVDNGRQYFPLAALIHLLEVKHVEAEVWHNLHAVYQTFQVLQLLQLGELRLKLHLRLVNLDALVTIRELEKNVVAVLDNVFVLVAALLIAFSLSDLAVSILMVAALAAAIFTAVICILSSVCIFIVLLNCLFH